MSHDADCCEVGISDFVLFALSIASMELTVDLDREFRLYTIEVENIGANRMLAAKYRAGIYVDSSSRPIARFLAWSWFCAGAERL